MVTKIDLQNLSEETIQEMGYNNHDLWMVKLNSVVYGPYEAESLKHYVSENESLFEKAEASRADETEWKPFWAHTNFQRRKPQVLHAEAHQGEFWLMDFGLKVGPFSFRDIDKKIEMGLLVMTDHISTDGGHHWHKIFEIEGFDRRSHSPDDLPVAPYESSFQKAKIELVEKLESHHSNTIEELSELTWEAKQTAKVIQFKLEEMTLRSEKQTEVSEYLQKWALPTAVAFVLTLATSGYMMMTEEAPETVANQETEKNVPFYKRTAKAQPKAQIPSPSMRKPASVGYSNPAPQETFRDTGSRYPTHVETHRDLPEPYEADPYGHTEADRAQEEVHSLLGNQNQGAIQHPEDYSLDAAMNGEPQGMEPVVDQPVIDESNDF